jgi:hypothetical protein
MPLSMCVMILLAGSASQDCRSHPVPADLRKVESSPDGNWLAMVHANGRAVSVLSTSTGEIRKVTQDFTMVEAIALATGRLLVAEAGTVGVYDLATLELRGNIKTGVPGITCLFAVPGQDDRAYAAAMVAKVSVKLHLLDLKLLTGRPVTVLGEFVPTVGTRLILIPSAGEYLLLGSGTLSRVLLQDERIIVVEGPVVAREPGPVELDDKRGLVFIGGVGLAGSTDLSTVFQPAPQTSPPSMMSGATANSLLAMFDGARVRLVDAWSGAELKVLPLPGDPPAPVQSGNRIVSPSTGTRVFLFTGDKVFDVPLGELKGKVPQAAFGRFNGIPKTLQVTPNQKFSFKPLITGLGKKVSYFARNAPKDLTVDAKTCEIRWTVPKDFSRSVVIQIGAKDEKNVEASLNFRLWAATPKDFDLDHIPLICNVGVPTEPVVNPEYRAWSRSVPGSWVTTHLTASQGTQIKFKITMEKVEQDRVSLQTEGIMSDGGDLVEKITMADGRKAKIEPYEIPRLINEGTETLQVGSKKVACVWRETIQNYDGRERPFKTWWSEEVPGGIVKQIIGGDGLRATTVTVVTGWEKK